MRGLRLRKQDRGLITIDPTGTQGGCTVIGMKFSEYKRDT